MKRYILILALVSFSLTGLSSCYMEDGAPRLSHHYVTGGNWHNHMGGGFHGGLNNEQYGAHPRHGNGAGDVSK